MVNKGSVCLAYIHDVDVAYSWHHSIVDLIMYDGQNDGRILRGGYESVRCAKSSDLYDARNRAVAGFLDQGDAEWLFFVDTDMGFTPDTVDRLLAAADPKERPIVGALCFANREIGEDGKGGFYTMPRFTIFDWADIGNGRQFIGRTTYPINGLVQCAATGSACIIIHRSVLQDIRDEFGDTWYNRITGDDGKLVGEDISFCVRAGSLNVPTFVDTSVKTSHLKNIWLQEQDFWSRAQAPASKECVDVLVPVMERPQNAKPFMESLRASTGLATAYAIANESDAETIEAWEAAGATVLRTDLVSFADKINYGYEHSDNPWIFVVGDDVKFHSGWLDHAEAVAGEQFHVIGTNDLGNPRVTSGDHATHMLIRRSYVDDVGASWDGPKVVAHSGYRHWFVDDEIVEAAKQRRVWGMALGSIVEHLHPAWKKGKPDEVYARGEGWAAEDSKLYKSRYRKYARSSS